METKHKDIQSVLSQMLKTVLLPVYCNDPKRDHPLTGFKESSIKVSDYDAHNFVKTIQANFITDIGGGRYVLPLSNAKEVLFWEGRKNIIPRPITLWLEPLITFATIGRLHLDFGWPVECLGIQSKTWEFDFITAMPNNLEQVHIAGEVKKTKKELDYMIEAIKKFCSDPDVSYEALNIKEKNAYKKWKRLGTNKAPFFWAVGPDGYDFLFEVIRSNVSVTKLVVIDNEKLHYV